MSLPPTAEDRPVAVRLDGRVALVTGATRGIGKGIALELGIAGAVVYMTGRTVDPRAPSELPGSLADTVQELERLGGVGVALACDHHDDDAVRAVMARIERDHGRLDVLVNNVYSSPDLGPWLGRVFWELPVEVWDQNFDIGVRSHYVASALAVPLLLCSNDGLVVNISSPGGGRYLHNVPYGVAKAALDRLSADTAHELAGRGVTVVSLWPGLTRTEFVIRGRLEVDGAQKVDLPEGAIDLSLAETPRFSGRAVVALAGDGKRAERSGKAWPVAELARAYGFSDIDGRVPDIERVATA